MTETVIKGDIIQHHIAKMPTCCLFFGYFCFGFRCARDKNVVL